MVEATRVREVGSTVQQLLRMGEVHKAVDLLIATGFGGHVTIGALTTPITGGGGGTTLDINQPAGVLNISADSVMIPIRMHVQAESGLIAADSEVAEILIAVDTEKAQDGLNQTTATNEQVYNLRGDLGNSLAGRVSAWSAITANVGTAPVHTMELARAQSFRDVQGTAANALATQFELLYEPMHPPLLTGAAHLGAALIVDWGGTVALPAFAQLQFVTFPKQWVYGFGND